MRDIGGAWGLAVKGALPLLLLLVWSAPVAGADRQGTAAVSSPERLATVAGLKILRDGGSAADAAVTVAYSLGVLRPLESGLGSGGVALYYDRDSDAVWALDFRSGAPNPAYAEESAPPSPVPMAVPGLTAGMGELHRKFGALPWKALLEMPAALARERARPDAGAPDSDANLEGLTSPAGPNAADSLAAMLERIGARGPREFYEGEISKRLVAASRSSGGLVTQRALAEYQARWRSPIQIEFRGDRIFALPPPASAGSAFVEMLDVLAGFAWNDEGGPTSSTIHLFVEAERFARYRAAAATIERGSVHRMGGSELRKVGETRREIEKGTLDLPLAPDAQQTISFALADERGNVAVIAMSLGPLGGSGVLVDDAFVLALPPTPDGMFSALPLIVIGEQDQILALASSGKESEALVGAGIYLRYALLAGDLQKLVEAPRFVPASDVHTIICEKNANLDVIDGLNILGHGVEWADHIGVVHLIVAGSGVATVSDPRGGTTGGY